MIRKTKEYHALKVAQQNYLNFMNELTKVVEEYEIVASKMPYSNSELSEKQAFTSKMKTILFDMNEKRNELFVQTAKTFSVYGKKVNKNIVRNKDEYANHKEVLFGQTDIIKLQETYNERLPILYNAVEKLNKRYDAARQAEGKL